MKLSALSWSFWVPLLAVLALLGTIVLLTIIYRGWEVHDAMYCVEHMCSLAEQGLG